MAISIKIRLFKNLQFRGKYTAIEGFFFSVLNGFTYSIPI